MTREAFIRKWLANPQKQYNEQFRDEMRNDLDLVIKAALRQPPVSGSLPCSKCGLGSHPVFGAQCMSNDCPSKGNDR